MRTLDLQEAAIFLKMHKEEVRRRAKLGILPGAKIGKCWVFIDDDLALHIRSLYAIREQALQVTTRKESLCHSLNAVVRGGSVLPPHGESELDALLKQKISLKRKNSMTN